MVTRAIVIAGNPIIREGLRAVLSDTAVRVLAVCRSAEDGVRQVRALAPEVAFVQVELDSAADLSLLEELKEASEDTAIIALGLHTGSRLFEAMHRGASSYLSHNTTRQSLLLAVEAAMQGYVLIDQAALDKACAGVANQWISSGNGTGASLTEREREVLRLLSDGLSNREIAGRLAISVGTVRTHVSSILYKLEVTDRVQAAVWATGHGLSTLAGAEAQARGSY